MRLPEFDECVKKKKLVRFPAAKKLAGKEIDIAGHDLATAHESIQKENYKWATIQAYYAMFHAARALLYHKGYREKSHYCLILAMKHFYASVGILDVRLVESLQLAKVLRENADYENSFDEDGSCALVEQAGEFVRQAKKIVLEKESSGRR